MNETQNTYEIDLVYLIKTMLKKWWMMAIPALVLALVFLIYTTQFVTPLYSSTAIMYINASTSSTINLSELETARNLVDSYEYLIKEIPQTLEEVADKAELDYTARQMRGMISVAGGGSSTEFLEITVTCPDAEEACLIANTIMEVVPGRAAATNMDSTISAAGWASIADSPSSPNVSRNVLLGFFLGIVLGAVAIVMFEMLDDRIKSSDWLKQTFKDEIPLLAVIPSSERSDRQPQYRKYYSKYSSNTEEE